MSLTNVSTTPPDGGSDRQRISTPVQLQNVRRLLQAASELNLPRLRAVRARLGGAGKRQERELEEALLALHDTATALDLSVFPDEAFQFQAVRKLKAGAEQLKIGLAALAWHAEQLGTAAAACTEAHAQLEAGARAGLAELQQESAALGAMLDQAEVQLALLEERLSHPDPGGGTGAQALDDLRRRGAGLRSEHRQLEAVRRAADAALRYTAQIVSGRQALAAALQEWAIAPTRGLQEQLQPLVEAPEACSSAAGARDARYRLQMGLVQASAVVARLLRLEEQRATGLAALDWADSPLN